LWQPPLIPFGQMENKVLWESFLVPFDILVEGACHDPVQFDKDQESTIVR